MRSPQEMTTFFRERGLKVTPQRECIFDVLHANATHPTAEAVYAEARRRMPTMSLKTVYQTLNDLADMGEIQVLSVDHGPARFDPNAGTHDHLVCVGCGTVRDVNVDVTGLRLGEEQRAGFSLLATDVVFRGLCPDCQSSHLSPENQHPRRAS